MGRSVHGNLSGLDRLTVIFGGPLPRGLAGLQMRWGWRSRRCCGAGCFGRGRFGHLLEGADGGLECQALTAENVSGGVVAFAYDGSQNDGSVDLAATPFCCGGCSFQYPLQGFGDTGGGGGTSGLKLGNGTEVGRHVAFQPCDVDVARAQNRLRVLILRQGQKQMLQPDFGV